VLNNDEDMTMMYLEGPSAEEGLGLGYTPGDVAAAAAGAADAAGAGRGAAGRPAAASRALGGGSGGSGGAEGCPVIDTISLEMLFENYLNEVRRALLALPYPNPMRSSSPPPTH